MNDKTGITRVTPLVMSMNYTRNLSYGMNRCSEINAMPLRAATLNGHQTGITVA